MIIKDSSIDLTIADVKSYLKMSLEADSALPPKLDLTSRCETEQLVGALKRGFKVGRFWLSASVWKSRTSEWERIYASGVCQMVPSTRTFIRGAEARAESRFVGSWNGIRGADAKETLCPGSSDIDQLTKIYHVLDADRGGVGR